MKKRTNYKLTGQKSVSPLVHLVWRHRLHRWWVGSTVVPSGLRGRRGVGAVLLHFVGPLVLFLQEAFGPRTVQPLKKVTFSVADTPRTCDRDFSRSGWFSERGVRGTNTDETGTDPHRLARRSKRDAVDGGCRPSKERVLLAR